MFYKHETNTYTWSTDDRIGMGATAIVYKGYNKTTANIVAVKVYKNFHFNEYPSILKIREYELLRKLKHENIVKLLDIENDLVNNHQVIIMEYCHGGSLLHILNQPENCYGLPQSDILLILKHLTAGIQYLRTQNIMHRDIKPDNIMKYITEHNENVYKLVDFGAARQLHEEESFESIYGTEEYIHPVYYEYVIFKQNLKQKLTAEFDLWPIGVTLFHIITGNLPFRAFQCKRNRTVMRTIYQNLNNNNYISGIQLEDDGNIIYSKTLPITCHLCSDLNSILSTLLVALLQINVENMITYPKFYEMVDCIFKKIPIHIFYVNTMSKIQLFVDPEHNFTDLLEQIQDNTMVDPVNQILIYKNNYLSSQIEDTQKVQDYPRTDNNNPIFLFDINKSNLDVKVAHQKPEPIYPNFQDRDQRIENIVKLIRITCITAHEYQRRIQNFMNAKTLMRDGFQQLIETHKINFMNLMRKAKQFRLNLDIAMEFSSNSNDKDLIELNADFLKTFDEVDSLYSKYVQKDILSCNSESVISDKKWLYQTTANEYSKYFVDNLNTSRLKIYHSFNKSSLTLEEMQFLSLEKINIADKVTRFIKLYQNEVLPNIKKLAEYYSDWWKLIELACVQAEYLHKQFLELQHRFDSIRNNLRKATIDDESLEDEPKKNKLSNLKNIKFIVHNLDHFRLDMKNVVDSNTEIVNALESTVKDPKTELNF